MKRLLLVFTALIVAANISFTQGTTPKTKEGSFGWLFTLGGLSNLGAGNYNDGVGAKYYIKDDLALRGGINFSTQSIPGSVENPQSYGINAGITYNWASEGAVVGYFGGMVGYGASKPFVGTGGETVDATTTVSIGALSGFEWFPWNQISLGGEYQLMFTSEKSPQEDASTTFSLGSATGANLILTVYLK